MRKNNFLTRMLLLLVCYPLGVTAQLPIVIVHGILSDAYYMNPLEDMIHQYVDPTVYVKRIQIGEGMLSSFNNMDYQVTAFYQEILNDPQLHDGFIILAHSQGSLVSRAYVEWYNNPRVFVYISMGGPHQGVFGTPGDYDQRLAFLNYLENVQHVFLYSAFAQKFFSIPGYWHDTIHSAAYLSQCWFLPYLNNEIVHPLNATFKNNITSLAQMVLINSDQEDVIEPSISCHFGFYQQGSKTVEQPLFETDLYKNDTLGLKTLYESNRLHFRMAHCTHTDYTHSKANFLENVREFLTYDPQKGTAHA